MQPDSGYPTPCRTRKRCNMWTTSLTCWNSVHVKTQVCNFLQYAICTPYYYSEGPTNSWVSYVYWTVHNLDSWIKRDQLHVTCYITSLFTAQHVSDVNTSILRSLRLIWWFISWVVLFWFDVCLCYFVFWLGWCGIRMQTQALLHPAYGYHTTPAKTQRNTNTHRTRAIQPMK